MKNKVLSFAAAVAIAANLITPVLAEDTASGNTASGNVVSDETASGNTASTEETVKTSDGIVDFLATKISGIDAAISADNAALSGTKTIVVNGDSETGEVATVKAAIGTQSASAYISSLGSDVYTAVCEYLNTSTLADAEIVDVINIDATQDIKDAIKNGTVVTLTLSVNKIVSTDDVALIHFHNGSVQDVLPASAGNGTVAFQLPNDFSPFVIVRLPKDGRRSYLGGGSGSITGQAYGDYVDAMAKTAGTTSSTSGTTTPSGYTVPNTSVK